VGITESDPKSSRSRSRRASKESLDSSQVPKALVETPDLLPIFPLIKQSTVNRPGDLDEAERSQTAQEAAA
jgi:hypothetical protein